MKFEVFRTRRISYKGNVAKYVPGDWYWRLKARNGKIIAAGGEGYTKRAAVLQAVARVRRGAFDATVEVLP